MMTGLALLAATGVAAGCGGGDEAEPLSKADFVKQGNKICADFDKDVAKDAEEIFAGVKSQKDLTPDKTREFFDVALPKFEAAVEELDALGPPEGDEEAVQAIVDAGKADSKKVQDATDDDEAITELVISGNVSNEFDKKAEAYGLADCGSQD